MMIIDNYPLLHMNTFGMNVKADRFIEWAAPQELIEVIPSIKQPILMIGRGSNLLFMDDFKGTVLHSAISTIEIKNADIHLDADGNILRDDSSDNDHQYVYVQVGSGVIMDDFVNWCCQHGLWGAENLAHIPGEVGAAAVQNIGAYGVEAKDIIDTVQTISIADGSLRDFSNKECQYSYRQSIFKNELKGQYAVTHVIFRLSLKPNPKLDYGALREEVELMGGPDLCNIRNAVIKIRESKLPDPQVTGNAGSFFMNPVIAEEQFSKLKEQYPKLPSYPAAHGMVKVAAGWLIEQSGWKGRSLGPAAVHDKQALVLINKGGAKGADIKLLADTIIADVRKQFGITLNTEVNYI